MTSTDILFTLHRALESGVHGAALRRLWTDDAVTTTYPNLISPSGGSSTIAEVIAASTRGAGLLESQRYELLEAFDIGDRAIARLTWTGVVAVDAGPLRAGQQLTAHIAQFATARGARIAALETYDCYDPL